MNVKKFLLTATLAITTCASAFSSHNDDSAFCSHCAHCTQARAGFEQAKVSANEILPVVNYTNRTIENSTTPEEYREHLARIAPQMDAVPVDFTEKLPKVLVLSLVRLTATTEPTPVSRGIWRSLCKKTRDILDAGHSAPFIGYIFGATDLDSGVYRANDWRIRKVSCSGYTEGWIRPFSCTPYCQTLSNNNYPNLTTLTIANCALTSIPSSVCELKTLESLDVSRNNITAINPLLVNLTKLGSLILAGNPLPRFFLPKNSSLPELKTIDLSGTYLSLKVKGVYYENGCCDKNRVIVTIFNDPADFNCFPKLERLFYKLNDDLKFETPQEYHAQYMQPDAEDLQKLFALQAYRLNNFGIKDFQIKLK